MGLKLHVTRIHKQYLKTVLMRRCRVTVDATLAMHTVPKRNVEQTALYMTILVMHALLATSTLN